MRISSYAQPSLTMPPSNENIQIPFLKSNINQNQITVLFKNGDDLRQDNLVL
jgi:hypothetical protein